jgi:hypothetical protein
MKLRQFVHLLILAQISFGTNSEFFYTSKPCTGYVIQSIESVLPSDIVTFHRKVMRNPAEHNFGDIAEYRAFDPRSRSVAYFISLFDKKSRSLRINSQSDGKIYFIEGTNTTRLATGDISRDCIATNAFFQAYLFVYEERDQRWDTLRDNLKQLFEQEYFVSEFVKSGALDGFTEEMRTSTFGNNFMQTNVQIEVSN